MPDALLADPAAPAARALPSSTDATGPEAALSALFATMSESGSTLGRWVVADPAGAVRMLRLLLALPKVAVRLPASGDRAEVVRALTGYAGSRRLTLGVTAVLELTTTPGGYLQGPSRATVRRKVRAAQRQGLSIRPVPAEDRLRLLGLADQHERTNLREEYRCLDPQNADLLDYPLWLAAHDAAGTPIALSVTPVSGEWATLRYFRTLVPGQASSDARYLLAAGLAEALREAGVRRLADTTRPHWLPNGLRHFQRMLGFRLVRLGAPRRADD